MSINSISSSSNNAIGMFSSIVPGRATVNKLALVATAVLLASNIPGADAGPVLWLSCTAACQFLPSPLKEACIVACIPLVTTQTP